MSSIITLLTDFGQKDGYVAAMKGVALSISSSVTLIDITHDIGPQNVTEAAFVIDTVYSYFPKGTIHIVVVDPGVGSSRNAILACVPNYYFLAPDNGVLTYVVSKWLSADAEDKNKLHKVEALEGSPVSLYRLANESYFVPKVSRTFHGRDIFAPVAAYLSKGMRPDELGERLNYIHLFVVPKPERNGGILTGEVIHVDRFGNLITNILPERIEGDIARVSIGDHVIKKLSQSYAEGEDILAIAGSSGRLEIAAKDASAGSILGLGIGVKVEVKVSK